MPALKDRDGIDFVIDDNVEILNASPLDFFTFDYLSALPANPSGILLAVRIPREQILAVDAGRGVLIQAATFGTFPLDTDVVATYQAAMIAAGSVDENGVVSVDISHPLVREAPFIGQDTDKTPLYVKTPQVLGRYAERWLPRLKKDLFLVLQVPSEEYPGVPGLSPYGPLVDFVSPGETNFGMSYFSAAGGATWHQENPLFQYLFGLVVAPR